MEVQRILHQRALDVKLDPELQKRCMTDLGKWCSEKTDTGQVSHNTWNIVCLLVGAAVGITWPLYDIIPPLISGLSC